MTLPSLHCKSRHVSTYGFGHPPFSKATICDSALPIPIEAYLDGPRIPDSRDLINSISLTDWSNWIVDIMWRFPKIGVPPNHQS